MRAQRIGDYPTSTTFDPDNDYMIVIVDGQLKLTPFIGFVTDDLDGGSPSGGGSPLDVDGGTPSSSDILTYDGGVVGG